MTAPETEAKRLSHPLVACDQTGHGMIRKGKVPSNFSQRWFVCLGCSYHTDVCPSPLPYFPPHHCPPLITRCRASLQHLPHPECDPALHGGAVHRRQRVLQVTPQHHPQRRDLLCVCR